MQEARLRDAAGRTTGGQASGVLVAAVGKTVAAFLPSADIIITVAITVLFQLVMGITRGDCPIPL
jgi:hypothetical protein